MSIQISNTPSQQQPALEPATQSTVPTTAERLSPAVAFINPVAEAPFPAIKALFDYLTQTPAAAAALNSTYARRGIFKTAASNDPACDQKFTVDLSPSRIANIPRALHAELSTHAPGFGSILNFFEKIADVHVPAILAAMSEISGRDLGPLHARCNFNFRLVDYTPATAAPASRNGCGAHTDYGTFAVIFQDGTAGLETEALDEPGVWLPVPGDATVLLCGWCAVVLSGGKLSAVRHRVRRLPGVRRLSAVLFVAPDLDVKMAPAQKVEAFSDAVNEGQFDVAWFKEAMGKKWRHREGNETLGDGDDAGVEQDVDIDRLIWK